MTRHVLWCVLPLAIACGEETKTGNQGTQAAPAPAKDAGAVTAAAAAADAAPPVPVDLTGGLAPIATQSPSKEAAAQATKLNTEALTLHRAGKLDEAAARYREALAADGSHLVARYNLASALATKGDAPQALAILAQFASAGPACAKCAERLARARNDGEWKALWDNPQFIMLTTAGAAAPKSEVIFLSFHSPEPSGEAEASGESAPITAAFQIDLEPPPGWALAPALEVTITSGKKTLVKKSWKPEQVKSASVAVDLEAPADQNAPVTATVKADGVLVGTVKTTVAKLSPESFAYRSVASRRAPARVARCEGLECPSFPALSLDGKTLAVRYADELISPGDVCNPPVGTRTSFLRVGKGELAEVPSQNLAGFEVLACDGGDVVALKDRFKAVHSQDENAVSVLDPAGKKIAGGEAYGFSVDFCQSAAHRLVVARVHGSVGGDCDEVGGEQYLTFSY
jgi:hypothetical protein